MKKWYSFLLLLLLFFSPFLKSLAQRSEQVSYEIKSDNPADFKNLYLQIYPMSLEMPNASLGIGIGANYRFSKIFTLNANIHKAYFVVKDYKKPLYAEAGAIFHLIDKNVTGNTKFVLSATEGSKTTINVPVTKHKIIGVRGGLFNDANFRENVEFAMEGNGSPGKSNFEINTFGAYGGINIATYINAVINATRYGTRKERQFKNIYADVLLGLSTTKPSDITYPNGLGMPTSYKISDLNSNPLGVRLGWSSQASVWNMNLSVLLEGGKRPGIGSGGYALFKVGFPIGLL